MKKHKIPLILSISLASILLLSIIVLSILQTNTKPELPNPSEIKIYIQSTSAKTTYAKGTDEYNEILKIYNEMFEQTYLNQLSNNDILEPHLKEDEFAPLWNDINKETGLYVEFVFDSPKKFIVHRGNNARRVDVSSIIFQLSKTDSIEPLYVYYIEKQESSNNQNNSTAADEEINYPIVAQANTHKLYKFIIEHESTKENKA